MECNSADDKVRETSHLYLLKVFLFVDLAQTQLALLLIQHHSLLVLERILLGLHFALDVVVSLKTKQTNS